VYGETRVGLHVTLAQFNQRLNGLRNFRRTVHCQSLQQEQNPFPNSYSQRDMATPIDLIFQLAFGITPEE
jgi:hypothetical protein